MTIDWIAVGACATGLAAIVTAWMASETRKAARAGKDAAKASQAMISRADEELSLLRQQTDISTKALRHSSTPILSPVAPRPAGEAVIIGDIPLVKLRSEDGHVHPAEADRLWSKVMLPKAESEGRRWDISELQYEGWDVIGTAIWFVFQFRNIGTGPALVTERLPSGTVDTPGLHVMTNLANGFGPQLIFRAQSTIIGAGEEGYFAARFDDPLGTVTSDVIAKTREGKFSTRFAIQLTYADLQRTSQYELHCDYEIDKNLDLLPVAPWYKGY